MRVLTRADGPDRFEWPMGVVSVVVVHFDLQSSSCRDVPVVSRDLPVACPCILLPHERVVRYIIYATYDGALVTKSTILNSS